MVHLVDLAVKQLILSLPITTKVSYAKSLDPDEPRSNLASHSKLSCLTLRQHFTNMKTWSTLKIEADEKYSRQFIWRSKGWCYVTIMICLHFLSTETASLDMATWIIQKSGKFTSFIQFTENHHYKFRWGNVMFLDWCKFANKRKNDNDL